MPSILENAITSARDRTAARAASAVTEAVDGRRVCAICGALAAPAETHRIRCNVRRFRERMFEVRRCASCRSLDCDRPEDLDAYYAGYPIRNQQLDYFSRAWYRVVLARLVAAGLHRESRILDYGCNQGLFIDFLAENGYHRCVGYDPYVERFASAAVLEQTYDFVISLDVIEHDPSPRDFLARLARLLAPGGRLCIETPNADGIDLGDPEEYLHAIHVPYHLHILSEAGLLGLAKPLGMVPIATYHRWYMDSWPPGAARRLFEPLMRYAGNDIDAGYEPPRLGLFFRHPHLLFNLFFGYFLPSTKRDHMMVILGTPAAA